MSRAFTTWAPGKVSADALTGGAALWGGKGLGLMQMCADGLPVPPGFTISTEVCAVYMKNSDLAMAAIKQDLDGWLDSLKLHFGFMPLVSVRSGARVSMPGMMDTVLNVGLCGANIVEWANRLGALCAADSHIRLENMFKSVVGAELPDDPTAQALACIEAVFKSWNSPRAIEYRKLHSIPENWGTAVNVQAMVFGNMGEDSGTGVAFTRDPSTGENKIVGEYLQNAQGEDVVAGIKKPGPLTDIRKLVNIKAYNGLISLLKALDTKYRDMQDVEFTIQQGKLWLLQTRAGKRSAAAAFRIVDDLVADSAITLEEARERVTFQQFLTAQRPVLNLSATQKSLGKAKATGIAGSIGVAVGRAVFCGLQVTKYAKAGGDPVILVRHETTPNDIAMMAQSAGVITATGGFTSHAAVVARGMNIPCVTGIDTLVISGPPSNGVHLAGKMITAGDWLTVDGASGQVWVGKGVTSSDADGASVRFVNRLAEAEGLRLRNSRPASRSYCVAADAHDLMAWVVEARTVEHATLDLRGLSAWVGDQDAAFLAAVGQDHQAALADAVATLCSEPARDEVAVILPDDAEPGLYVALHAAGYRPVRAVNTLDDAFQATGAVRFGPKLAELAGGEKGAAFLRKALEAAGATFADDDTGLAFIDAARQLLKAAA